MIQFQDNFIILETKNTCLVFEIKPYDDFATSFNKNKAYISLFFYGYKNECPCLEHTPNVIPGPGSSNDYIIDKLISSTFGNGNNKENYLLIENSDNTNINRFFFEKFNILEGGKNIFGPHTRNVKETLELIEYDATLNIEAHLYYSLLEDSDVIVSKREILNKSDKPFHLKRLFSLELPIETKSVDVETFDGAWLFERSRHISSINNGVFSIDSKIGSSSHKHNPYIQIIDKERNDAFYGFNLIYSGSHKELVEVNKLGHTTVMIGINDFAFSYKINPNESFISPEAIFTLKPSKDELTSEMHSFITNHIINPNFANSKRPVLFNSWEGAEMHINEKSLLEMAEIAKKIGIELFVVDDGWFKNRETDSSGLGDWEVDKNKLPNGLNSFVEKVRKLGLKFGIWIEPEMICIESDLYKTHPEFACIIPNREPIERRHQLMIDMSNPEVVDYLFDKLSKVFDEIKPDYIKWDFNRFHSDTYSSFNFVGGEFLYKYEKGTYELLERLTSRYPNTLIEGCSSGGGRYDLGMLYYTPQIWCSDDTNTYFRSFITCGTFTGYPQSTAGAHVTRDYCPVAEIDSTSSLEDRFNLNCFGAFGYEFDLRKYNDEQQKVMKNQISFYKNHRELLQFGQLTILNNVFDDEINLSYIIVSKDKKEAILLVAKTRKDSKNINYKIKGLCPNKNYIFEERLQNNLTSQYIVEKNGKELLYNGIEIDVCDNRKDIDEYPKGVFTKLFYIKEK